MSLRHITKQVWYYLTGAVATMCGFLSAGMLIFEGRFLGFVLLLIFLTVRFLAASGLGRPNRSADAIADWTAIHGITSFICLALPFYLALSA